MTAKQAQGELERVEQGLAGVIGLLVETPGAVEQWPVLLRASSDALLRVREQLSAGGSKEALVPILQRIQRRMKRVETLLEAAATFYCGCIAVGEPQHSAYAPDGEMQSYSAGGRMRLEA